MIFYGISDGKGFFASRKKTNLSKRSPIYSSSQQCMVQIKLDRRITDDPSLKVSGHFGSGFFQFALRAANVQNSLVEH